MLVDHHGWKRFLVPEMMDLVPFALLTNPFSDAQLLG
jgi:hypothetical protein